MLMASKLNYSCSAWLTYTLSSQFALFKTPPPIASMQSKVNEDILRYLLPSSLYTLFEFHSDVVPRLRQSVFGSSETVLA